MENITENTPQENGLAVLFKEQKISEESSLQLSDSFKVYYDQTNEWKKKATEFLNDPNISDDEKAKESRIGRLAMVKIRTGIEKTRKDLNEGDQQRISDRNAAAKVLTALGVPIEELLLAKEKEAEIAENNRKQAIKDERLSKLDPYGVDCTFFDLVNMPDQAFETLLENTRLAFEKKAEDEKRENDAREFEKKIQDRKNQLYQLGFTSKNDTDFTNELCDVDGEDIFGLSDEHWKNHLNKISDLINQEKKKKEAEKFAEDNRIKLENEELARKNALLQQQEKERKTKHDQTTFRLQSLIDINQKSTYDQVAEMDDQTFDNLYKEKKSEYEAEQNRIFIEKKKKERDEAMAKAEAEKKANEERIALLAPDKDKLKAWVNSNLMPCFGGAISEEGHEIANEIHAKFQNFNKWSNEQIEKLK